MFIMKNKKGKHKKMRVVALVCLCFVMAMTLIGCQDGRIGTPDLSAFGGGVGVDGFGGSGDEPIPVVEPKTPYSDISYEPGTWSIYWYLCGSDLESRFGAATMDLLEMVEVTLPGNVQIIIETGGTYEWKNDLISAGALERYIYKEGELNLISREPDENMSDPNTLADFLYWANQNYPAEKQAVIMWDHGGGSLFGVISDERFPGDTISLPALDAVLASAPASSGRYEMIGFDACLMATIETADVVSKYARYMVASEESEPGCGWQYTGVFSALAQDTTISGADLGRAICDSFYQGCLDISEKNAKMTTLSVVDLDKFPVLMDAFLKLGDEALIGSVENRETYISQFGKAARNAENYGGNNDQDGYFNMVDIGDLVRKAAGLLPQNSEAVLSALDDCVLYQIKGAIRSEATGLACYYSYDGETNILNLYSNICDIPGFKYFYEYMLQGDLSDEGRQYVKQVQSTVVTAPDEPITIKTLTKGSDLGLDGLPVIKGANGHYVLDVGSEKAKNIAWVNLHVLWYSNFGDKKEVDMVMDLGYSRAVDASQQSAGIFTDTFDGNIPMARNVGTQAYTDLYTEVVARDPGQYTLYTTPVLLNKEEECQLLFIYSETTKEYNILGTSKPMNKDSGMSDKLRQLEPDDIMFTIGKVANRDYSTGEFGPLDFGDVHIDPAGNAGGFVLLEPEIYDGEFELSGWYRVQFEIVDYAGKRYLSEAGWYNREYKSPIITQIDKPNVPELDER